jgi:hypothetical protein
MPRKPKTKRNVPGAAAIGDNSGIEAPLELSADERRQLFLRDVEQYGEAKAALASATADVRNARKRAKADGFTRTELEAAVAMHDPAGEERVRMEVLERLRAAKWMGAALGTQFDLLERLQSGQGAYFGPSDPFDAGKLASMQNQPRKPPHDPGTEAYEAWMNGYAQDQERISRGFKSRPPIDTSQQADGIGNDPADFTTQIDEGPISGERLTRSEFSKRLQDLGKL